MVGSGPIADIHKAGACAADRHILIAVDIVDDMVSVFLGRVFPGIAVDFTGG